MSAAAIARKHFEAAIAEATAAGYDTDSLSRYMLDCVVAAYLAHRPFADVQSELRFVADNCDPAADFIFMRP